MEISQKPNLHFAASESRDINYLHLYRWRCYKYVVMIMVRFFSGISGYILPISDLSSIPPHCSKECIIPSFIFTAIIIYTE